MGRDSFDRSKSPVRNHRSSHRSPSRRERSPASRHRRSSYTAKSPGREKPSSRTRSPVRANSISRSPSPRASKRSRRDRLNHKDDKSSERGLEKNHRSPVHRNSRSPESPRTRRLRRAEADRVNGRATRKEKKDLDSETRDRKSGRHRSRSPPRDEGNHSKEDDHRNGNNDSVARMKAAEEALETKEKQKPSFELSGKLAAETNRVKGVTLLFTEPPDARKPDIRWRLYVFKGGEVLNEPLYVHRQTCYLFGRERRVADIPTDHPSCSKQHAVLQYRQVEKEQPGGMLAKEVRPYIMDLGSTNGTFINDNRIEPERYYELMEKDTIKFGNSSREYVLLHENSAG